MIYILLIVWILCAVYSTYYGELEIAKKIVKNKYLRFIIILIILPVVVILFAIRFLYETIIFPCEFYKHFQSILKARGFTKEEAKAHSEAIKKNSKVVKKVYDI